MSSTIRDEDTAFLCGSAATARAGHFYLDVSRSRLYSLNETARKLRKLGVPLMADDAQVVLLRTVEGSAVRAEDLPLPLALRHGRPADAEYLFARPGQPAARLQFSASPLKDADDHVGAVLASVFCLPPMPDWHGLAGLAHDLRTPLQAVAISLEILQFRTLPEEQRHQALARLSASAERAQQIAQELLNWCQTRGTRGGAPHLAWFALEPLVREVVAEQQPAATKRGLSLDTSLGVIRGWQVNSDRGRLARVLANLLVNAVRYTPSGGRVSVDAAWRDESGARVLAIEVHDTGTGISPHEQESIFHPFERGQTGHDSDVHGSGIGLSVVDQLTQELGLRCEVHSAAGQGSQFCVIVPPKHLRMAPQSVSQS
jgi:hypothetical protein